MAQSHKGYVRQSHVDSNNEKQQPIPDGCIGYDYGDKRLLGIYVNGRRALHALYTANYNAILSLCPETECYFRNFIYCNHACVEGKQVNFIFKDGRKISIKADAKCLNGMQMLGNCQKKKGAN